VHLVRHAMGKAISVGMTGVSGAAAKLEPRVTHVCTNKDVLKPRKSVRDSDPLVENKRVHFPQICSGSCGRFSFLETGEFHWLYLGLCEQFELCRDALEFSRKLCRLFNEGGLLFDARDLVNGFGIDDTSTCWVA